MQLVSETEALLLEWSPGREHEGKMRSYVVDWLHANPIGNDESREMRAYRTILERIANNLDRSAVTATDLQSVEYSTVWSTIVRSEKLSEDTQEYSEWRDALDIQWSELVAFIANNFLKPEQPLSTESSSTAPAWN